MNKWQFVTMEAGEIPRTSDSFEGAWRDMYAWVQGLLATGQATWQVIETSIWILTPEGDPIMFYAARDRACDEGIMDKIKAEEALQKAQVSP